MHSPTRGKVVRTIFLICILTVLVPVFFIVSHYGDVATTPKECAVVFGAAVWRDNIPSHALYDRTVTAVKLYNDNLVDCIVLSGGASTYGAHEVTVMQDILFRGGVPTDVLILDRHGVNTLATITHLAPDKSYIMLSNDFHLARIALLATRAGITDFSLHAATYHAGRYVKEPRFFLREVAAYLYYSLFLNKIF